MDAADDAVEFSGKSSRELSKPIRLAGSALGTRPHICAFITHMEWALKNKGRVTDLLEYEASANEVWERQEGPFNPVICTYDLTKFGADIIVDVMRTHPMIILGGILQENPFYVPPKQFLQMLRE